MAATLILREKEYEVAPGTTILYSLIKLKIDMRVVRPVRDGELIRMQEILQDGDVIHLVPLISGG